MTPAGVMRPISPKVSAEPDVAVRSRRMSWRALLRIMTGYSVTVPSRVMRAILSVVCAR